MRRTIHVRSLNGNDRRLYIAWKNMRARCRHHKNYAGRGIKICTRWTSFAAFVVDMGLHPGTGWSLDRKDNNGNYSKNNCRWATPKTQMRNCRQTKLTFVQAQHIRSQYRRGVNQHRPGTAMTLARKYKVSYSLIS